MSVPVITPALLSALGSHPSLPRHTWYLVAATTLTILNRPDEIPQVYRYALEQGGRDADAAPDAAEQRRISRRLREALIKASAVGGVPKAINSLLSLKEATPAELQDAPGAPSPTGRRKDMFETPPAQILERGQLFFDRLYGKIAKRVMGQMDRSGTEDLGLTARLVYGYLLSNTQILSPIETSIVMIAGLIPQDVNPQLKGHLRGALNGGATVEEVRAVREVSIRICEAAGMARLAADEVVGWGWRNEVANV